MRLIGENYRDGDLVWVDTSAGGPYGYYRDHADWFPHTAFRNVCAEDCHFRDTDKAAYVAAVAEAKHHKRVWVFAVFVDELAVAAERSLIERFDAVGTRTERVEMRGAAVTLFEL